MRLKVNKLSEAAQITACCSSLGGKFYKDAPLFWDAVQSKAKSHQVLLILHHMKIISYYSNDYYTNLKRLSNMLYIF